MLLKMANDSAATDSLYKLALKYAKCVTRDLTNVKGYVDNEVDLDKFFTEYQLMSGISFVTRTSKCRKDCYLSKEKSGSPGHKKKLYWQSCNGDLCVDYFGAPFEVGNYYIKQCSHGKLYRKNHNNQNKQRRTATKKLGCEATLYIKEVLLYPDFEVSTPAGVVQKQIENRKIQAMTSLRQSLALVSELNTVKRIFFSVPLNCIHNHPKGNLAKSLHPIQEQLSLKIEEFVRHGITNTRAVTHELREFVKKKILPMSPKSKPCRSDRSFYPTRNDVKKHVLVASLNYKLAELESLPEERKEEDSPSHPTKGDGFGPISREETIVDISRFQVEKLATKTNCIRKFKVIVETG